MTTAVQPLSHIQLVHAQAEIHWYVSTIILPELSNLAEALQICSNLLRYNAPLLPDSAQHRERGPPIKLPVSSTKLEAIKGTMTRDGSYITQMSVQLKEPHFNKVLHRLVLRKPIKLPQIVVARDAIEAATAVISHLDSFLPLWDECSCEQTTVKPVASNNENHKRLADTFRTLLGHLEDARNNLQIPSDPNLVFPLNVTPANTFEPELTHNIAVDLYVTRAEVCIDMKHLHTVREKPWCDIDPASGKSYVDNLRDEMRLPASSQSSIAAPAQGKSGASTPQPPTQPLNMADIEQRLSSVHSAGASVIDRAATPNLFGNVLLHLLLKHRYDPIDYVTKCITYNHLVVMVNKKIEVSSADPVLVSVFTKLDSIAYLVGTFLENIETILAVAEQ